MRILGIIFILFIEASCHQRNVIATSSNSDLLRVDAKYVKGTWTSYFQPIRTPLGITIRFKIINDSSFLIQWGHPLNLKTFPDTLKLDVHEAWIPRYIAENKDYIVLRQGCGNPCWVGYFLPLNDSIKEQTIHEYLDFDLSNNLVAWIKGTNVIEIVNLKTKMNEEHKINGCGSSFLGYCIDSLSIKDKTLKYKWFPKTKFDSERGIIMKEKIKI